MCVCDGAALRYWSQVASTLLAIRYVENLEKKLKEFKSPFPEESAYEVIPIDKLKEILKTTLLETNKQILCEKDLENNNVEIDLVFICSHSFHYFIYSILFQIII